MRTHRLPTKVSVAELNEAATLGYYISAASCLYGVTVGRERHSSRIQPPHTEQRCYRECSID